MIPMKALQLLAITISTGLVACMPEPGVFWYQDVDGDGYGDPATEVVSSNQPDASYVNDNSDCDDTDAAVNPNGIEINDEIDNNCDGMINDAPFSIGDWGAAGGIVFYVTNGGNNGLEAAPVDQSSAASFGCFGTITAANDESIGAGAQNTAAILADPCAETGIAADLADSYSLNNFTDWFLPSKDELNQLYIQRDAVGNMEPRGYWSSTENGVGAKAWSQIFTHGGQSTENKDPYNALLYVRAIRAF